MHDIICPHCGESFIASDVAFDLSEYVLPLLYSDPKDSEDIRSVGFKFYVDEDMVRKHTVSGNKVPLFCDKPGGPSLSESWYPFVITNATIFQHIQEQVSVDGNLADFLEEIEEIQNTRGAHYLCRQLRH